MKISIKNIERLRRTGPPATELLEQIKKEKTKSQSDGIIVKDKKENQKLF